MDAVEALDITAAENGACEAQRNKIRESLGVFEDIANMGAAFDMSFGDLSFVERSNDGDVAVVQVNGSLTISFLGQQEEQVVDEEHVVVRKDGQWVVCDP